MRLHFALSIALGLALIGMSFVRAASELPVKIIFDTDMCGDFDDVGALAVLNKEADFGKAEILACVASCHDKDKAIAASISAINTYYGRPNIPIGTYQGPGYPPYPSHYTAALRDEFPQSAKPDDQEPRSLDIYRKTLAAAPDGSVVIVSTGLLVNLRNLLESKSDAFSPLSGIDLVRNKVKKLVTMGGQYPQGCESNFISMGAGPDTQYVLEHWPTPVLLSGFEIGLPIITGKVLASVSPKISPVRRAYDVINGRPSWDLTAALAAVEDPTLYWTVSEEGYCEVLPSGCDQWHATPKRGHRYLIAKLPPAEMVKVLDGLLALPPKTR
jgi:hypothetical protein